uniref:Transmembrane protein n=1 Tax=Echinococcus canadensis TaxID=519352 RepID=A0A915EWC8_9CEST
MGKRLYTNNVDELAESEKYMTKVVEGEQSHPRGFIGKACGRFTTLLVLSFDFSLQVTKLIFIQLLNCFLFLHTYCCTEPEVLQVLDLRPAFPVMVFSFAKSAIILINCCLMWHWIPVVD